MVIIFGGAFQGKLAYALENYDVGEGQIQRCNPDSVTIDASKKLFVDCHELVFALVKEGKNPLGFFQENLPFFQEKILIFDDISCGVVPVDALVRKVREENGKVMAFLCERAASVTRVFCKIPTQIKSI